MNHTAEVQELATAIKGLRSHVARLAKPFRHDPLSGKPPNFNKWSAADWRRNIFANALVRLEQLTANHFDFIETMGVVVVARYIFELSVWLHLLGKDSRYGLVYYRELLDSQRRHFEDRATHLRREVLLLRQCERMDDSATQSLMEEYKAGNWSQIAEVTYMFYARLRGHRLA